MKSLAEKHSPAATAIAAAALIALGAAAGCREDPAPAERQPAPSAPTPQVKPLTESERPAPPADVLAAAATDRAAQAAPAAREPKLPAPTASPEDITIAQAAAASADQPGDDDLLPPSEPAPAVAPEETADAPAADPRSADPRYQPVAYRPVDVPDLGRRTDGVDWPQFLGPNQDSKSPETGILTDWPEQGPPLVWQRSLGVSYDIGSISRGRLFQFDRHGDQARLSCLHAETGELLWKWEYPTDYSDYYGYNNGPRCSPIVDGDRVYLYGAEGMLHCLRVTDGQLLWRVDTVEQFGVVQNFFGVGSTPVIEGDLLLVIVGGSPESSQGLGSAQLDLVEATARGL